MVDRMAISYHKYGAVADAKGKVDEVSSLLLRLAKYAGTRKVKELVATLPDVTASKNTEFMMDVANFGMIVFMHEGPKKFKATDSNHSPGLVHEGGLVTDCKHDGTPQPGKEAPYMRQRREGD
jgi:hypothetical protein